MVTPGDLQNRTRPPAEECVCQGAGRIGDAVCPDRCDASLPYYAATGPDPEQMRLARELAVLMAANAGT